MAKHSPKGRKAPQHLGTVRWDAFTHRHMWNMVMDAHPNDVFERYDRWQKLGEGLININKTVQAELNSLFQTWQGTAALSAANSNARLLQWSQEAAETTQRIGEDLGTYGNALVEARKRMPQPRVIQAENEFRAGEGATVAPGQENSYMLLQIMSDHRATAQERTEAKDRAIDVMRTFEQESVQVTRQLDVHTYSTAPGATSEGDGGDLPDFDDNVSGDGGNDIPPDFDWGPPDRTDPAAIGPAGVGGHGPGGFGPGAFGPGGVGPGGAGFGPGGYAPGGYGLGPGDAAAGGGGYGRGLRAVAFGAEGAAARGVPGQEFSAQNRGAAAAEAAARGGPGAGGRGGAGALYPPMAGGVGGDDDKEKRVAPYLIDDEDLFDDERTVAPPVFGA